MLIHRIVIRFVNKFDLLKYLVTQSVNKQLVLWTGSLFPRFVTGCFQKEITWLFISELTPVKNPLLVIFATIVRPRDQTWTPILELNIQMGCHGIHKISRHPILLFKKTSVLLIYLETQSVNKQLVSASATHPVD